MNLDSLRCVLTRLAYDDASVIIAGAVSQAEQTRSAARARADAAVALAVDEGHEAARHEAAIALRDTHRRARALVLAAQRTVANDIERDALNAVMALRSDGMYPALLTALTRIARERLGPDAVVAVDPPRGGGVYARAGTRVLDLTLPSLVLAQRALQAPSEATLSEAGAA